jgi:DNA-binding transcriptional regulator GbsR (MarR family)
MGSNGKRKRVFVECRGYNEEEARSLGLNYVSSYRLLQSPGWFKCDDENIICYCYKIEPINIKNVFGYVRTLFRTDIGSLYATWRQGVQDKHTPANFRVFRASGFIPLYTKNEYSRFLRRSPRWRAFCIVYAGMVASNKKINMHVLAAIISPENPTIGKVYKILRYSETKEMIEQELRKQFEASGVTVNTAIQKLEEAYAIAKGKKDAQSMIRVAENYLEVFKKNAKNPQQDPAEIAPSFEVEQNIAKAEEQLNAGAPKSIAVPDNMAEIKKSIKELEEYEQNSILQEASKLLEFPTIPKLP